MFVSEDAAEGVDGLRREARAGLEGPLSVGRVVCSMGVSLDGYTVGPDGRFDWSAPDEELFAFATDQVRRLGGHLLGRRLYETMSYWETAGDDPASSDLEREFARVWNALPKVVFSRTLTSVDRQLPAGDRDARRGGRARCRDGDLAVGGAELAAEAAALGLVDEYGLRVHPVLVGGGTPFFPRAAQRADLELADSRTFAASGVQYLQYRVRR